jgi:hypothetical protein
MARKSAEISIPKPFLLNALKHHKGSISAFIERYGAGSHHDLEDAARQLITLGNLVMDLYTGDLGISEITEDIKQYLKRRGFFEEESYRAWISRAEKTYRVTKVIDGSTWTLLTGRDHGRYIHIHPARYSLHSFRIKALPLKTAVLLLIADDIRIDQNPVEAINRIRMAYLKESPIGDEKDVKNTLRVLTALRS